MQTTRLGWCQDHISHQHEMIVSVKPHRIWYRIWKQLKIHSSKAFVASVWRAMYNKCDGWDMCPGGSHVQQVMYVEEVWWLGYVPWGAMYNRSCMLRKCEGWDMCPGELCTTGHVCWGSVMDGICALESYAQQVMYVEEVWWMGYVPWGELCMYERPWAATHTKKYHRKFKNNKNRQQLI